MKTTLLIAALALGLAGCSTVKSTAQSVGSTVGGWFGSDAPGASKPSALVEFKAVMTLAEAWKTGVGEPGAGLFVPTVADNAVYAAGEKSLVRIALDSGRKVWDAKPDGRFTSGVGASASLVVAGNVRGELQAFDAANGAPRWKVKLSSELAGPPVQAGEIIIVRTGDGLVRGLAAATGERAWQYSRSLPPLALRGSGGMTASDGSVYVGFAGGKLVALDAARGTQLWEATVATPRGATELERIADVIGAPWVDATRVCAAAYQGRVACFERKTGSPLWARDASTHAGLAADGSALYLVEDDDEIVQHDLETGRAGWKQGQLARRRLSAPLVFGDYLVVGDAAGYVHVLSRADGRFVGRARVEGAVTAAPVNLGPGFAVQTAEGSIVAFKIK